MSRNGSGTYTLPAGQPVVTGTIIDSTIHNAFAADVAAALTASLAKDGQTVPSANIPMGTFKITGLGDATLATDAMNRQAADARYPQLAAANTFTAGITVSTTSPLIDFTETDAAVDNKRWRLVANTESFRLQVLNDAASGTEPVILERTGTTVDSIALTATAITVNGVAVSDFARLSVANTFTGTLTQSTTDPVFIQTDSNAAVDEKHYWINGSGNLWRVLFVNDALGVGATPISVTRTGATASAIALTATAITLNGVNVNSAAILTSGTLGVVNGSNVTALNATQLTTGTVPDARFPATLPALSGVNLTALNATNLGSGTVPDARFPATLPALSGVNLTALNATQLTSGIIPSARVTTIDAACTVNSQTVGYRGVPRSTTATTLAIGDVGKCVAITATINIPISVFAAGDAVTIYNDSGGALNLTISAGTLRLAGTATTGTRSISQRGFCTIWFNTGGATPDVIASGNVT